MYAWSVFTKPLINEFGWSIKQVTFTFSLAILFLGLSAAFLGHFVEKHGPRKAGLLATVFFGIGIAGSGLAVNLSSLPLLYLFYGVFGGIGLGVGYITPVSSLVKWFPDRRGLATGLAIMGFGFASLISSPVMARLIDSVGIANTFYILGAVYFILMGGSSLYLSPPPAGWMPEQFKAAIESGRKKIKVDLSQLTANEAVKTARFWMLWLMLFINVTCGIAIISVASPMAQEIAKMAPLAAASMVGLMGLFNGLGRIGWASFSDYIGRPNTYTAFFRHSDRSLLIAPRRFQRLAVSNFDLFDSYMLRRRLCIHTGLYRRPVRHQTARGDTWLYFDRMGGGRAGRTYYRGLGAHRDEQLYRHTVYFCGTVCHCARGFAADPDRDQEASVG